MDFAVRVKGIDEPDGKTARWVLAVDKDAGLLVSNNEGELLWCDPDDCTFVKLISPELPHPVYLVQPANQGPQLVAPNRAARRALERNGNE